MFKVLGIVVLVLALVVGILPQFTDCQSQGKALALANGKTTSMKCHWTARAELALAAPLLAVGALTATSRRRENRRNLGIMGAVLGIVAIALPTSLIGVCTNPMMMCDSLMKPSLLASGSLITVASIVGLVIVQRGKENAA